MSSRSPEESSVDALRRRLYEPGATEGDVTRYRAAREVPEETSEPAPPAHRPRRIGPVVAGVALVAGLATAAVLLGGRTPEPIRTVTSAPHADEQELLVAGSQRAAFVRALDAGRDAGLLPYIERQPDARPDAVRTVQRAASTEYAGEGPAVIDLEPSALAERGGRATVIVVLDRAAAFRWSATRLDPGRDSQIAAVAEHGGSAGAGAPVSSTFAYGRGAPARLGLVVPARARWGVVVVFTD